MTKVVHAKLRRYKALGMVLMPFTKRSVIRIDPRQRPKQYFNTLIHEKLHIMYPDWSESKIEKAGTELSNFLWENNYRKIIQ